MRISPRGSKNLLETNRVLDEIVSVIRQEMDRTGIRASGHVQLLWGS